MLSKVWVIFVVLSVLCGILTGRMDQVSNAATQGASEAVTLIIGIVGVMALWSGIMEVVQSSGLSQKIEWCMRPILRLIFGKAAHNRGVMELVSSNITANLLGLSNAATPIGLQAASALYESEKGKGAGTPDAVIKLITLNTASIQLIPSTVAAIRASYGSKTPFDIMPAVWCASAASVAAVLIAGRLLRPWFPDSTGNRSLR